ncbi:helix-turn-helix domain-containing protein [Clostridium perfringens]|uniref:helix-turn-helix domain-containing protein n=1 Tax=Clostridium perfringens TaxID=1502 RepID=UPI0039EB7113
MADKEVLNEFKNNRFDYFNAIMDNKTPIEINRVEKMVLISLIRHNNWKTGICNPTIKTIQNEWFYKSDREVIEALKTLREKNFFTKQTIKRRNYYKLNIALILKDYLQNDGNPQNVGNLQNEGDNIPQNVGNDYPQNEGTNIKETEKEHKNIYSSLENELNTKEIEKDLIKKINSKYSKDLIKEEFEKLKDKGLSELDLLKELDKNLKAKSKVKKDKYSEDSKEYKLSILLRDLILRRDENSRCKNADMQKWSKEIDLLHRKDNRSYEDIEKIIRWCQQDVFWKANILSTHKLREKFDSLYQKAFYENKSYSKNNFKNANSERSNDTNGECWYFKDSL